ncbi:putative peptidase family-domain-containing protein [Leucosporidium creatinivorum]|uniref:Putative peptidase family-domain-containing protein n=1 Tax=Leucosporidium creatinivorum TaxID=106004 RepID=A0A1Y2E8Q0_9BASI|nr:putative peptidase family-domain-containing protein [Leucosporidium creatinivorum]
MLSSVLVSALAIAGSVQAAPFFGGKATTVIQKRAEVDDATNKAATQISEVQIHESCNAAQTRYLRAGLDEMVLLARHAHDRILSRGEEDELYRTYFGNASSASTSGFYAQIAYGNKPGVLLRCDDPDGNCAQTTAAGPWAGHWRGTNATLETVICPRPVHTNRLHLARLCWDENYIGVAPAAAWLATDLLHRMTHIPSITYHHVGHHADTYPGVLELASNNDTNAAFNQNTFQYYAIDAYARDVAYPPHGCVGANATLPVEDHDHDHASTSSALPSATATATSTAAESCHTHADGEVHCEGGAAEAPSATTSAAQSCHTHADGEVHCE